MTKNTTTHALTLFLFLLSLATASVVLAQDGSRAPADGEKKAERKAPTGERWVERLDLDGDGKVSTEEFDGPSEHFARLDRDGDGYLAANEAPPPRRGPHPGGPRQGRPGETRGQGPEDGGETRGEEGQKGGRPSFVARLDQDGDGRVSAEEFDGPAEHFADFDVDQDGFISEDEAPHGPPPPSRRPPRQQG